jgi:UDP-N-acetyl-D-mannosaminuronic acid dehydrogenase
VPGLDVRLAHCPERVLPGATLVELVHNDRIIGGIDADSTEAARRFYAGFVRGDLVATDDVTAELCKLAENAYRYVNIALANQVASLADSFGVDPAEAIALANRHPRVDLLAPGIGVGGHCLPLDPWFLRNGEPGQTVLIDAARGINDAQPLHVAAQIRHQVGRHPDPRVLLVGAAYKPEAGDVRESPALRIRDELEAAGVVVRVYDPMIEDYSGELVELAAGTDLVAVLVPHRNVIDELQTRQNSVVAAMRTPGIVDFSTGRARPFAT